MRSPANADSTPAARLHQHSAIASSPANGSSRSALTTSINSEGDRKGLRYVAGPNPQAPTQALHSYKVGKSKSAPQALPTPSNLPHAHSGSLNLPYHWGMQASGTGSSPAGRYSAPGNAPPRPPQLSTNLQGVISSSMSPPGRPPLANGVSSSTPKTSPINYTPRSGTGLASRTDQTSRHSLQTSFFDEIQPINEQDEAAVRAHQSLSSRTSTPMSIPMSAGTRTYRVVISPQPSIPGQTSPLGGNSAKESVLVMVDSGGADRGGGGLAGDGSGRGQDHYQTIMSTSQQQRGGFLSNLFNMGGLKQTTDAQIHAADLLPHHYRQSPTTNPTDLMYSTSPLDVGSVLAKASGALRKQHSSKSRDPLASFDENSNSNSNRRSGGGGGLRAFASMGNLTSVGGNPQGDGSMTPSQGGGTRSSELRYPHMQQWLRQHTATNGSVQGAGVTLASEGSGWGVANLGVRQGSDNAGHMNRSGGGGGGGNGMVVLGGSYGDLMAGGGVGVGGGYVRGGMVASARGMGGGGGGLGGQLMSSQANTMPLHSSLVRSASLLALLQHESGAGDTRMCAADIAVLSSSLPASFGHPAAAMMKRVDSITGSPALSRAESIGGGGSHDGWGGYGGQGGPLSVSGRLMRQDSTSMPPALPICLICLEMLTPADFASGEALQLECLCKGEVAMRHRACAKEWSNVKGNLICDICKHPIANLPPIDPAIVAAREEARRRRQPLFAIHPDPTLADYVFDAIRVAWVTIICCILFVDGIDVGSTFIIGAVVGVVYCLLSLLLHWACNSWRARRRLRLLTQQQQLQQQQPYQPHQPHQPQGYSLGHVIEGPVGTGAGGSGWSMGFASHASMHGRGGGGGG